MSFYLFFTFFFSINKTSTASCITTFETTFLHTVLSTSFFSLSLSFSLHSLSTWLYIARTPNCIPISAFGPVQQTLLLPTTKIAVPLLCANKTIILLSPMIRLTKLKNNCWKHKLLSKRTLTSRSLFLSHSCYGKLRILLFSPLFFFVHKFCC